MIVYALIAGAALAIFLMLLKWSLKTVLPRSAGVVIDHVYATGGAIVNKLMALMFLLFLGFIAYVAFVAPHAP